MPVARTLKERRWIVEPRFAGAELLARRLGTSPLVAQLLHNRGVGEVEPGEAFLNPSLSQLHDPSLLIGADRAARRIAKAVANDEPIVLYGDYDVDGITGVAILHACLRMVGARVSHYVPHRLEEGYGLNSEAVAKLIADGMKLLVTVDCGVTAVEPVAQAKAAGVEVIITDHHTLGPELPDAMAIVHPDLPGQDYPNPHLAGAGVAFKLAWQVARQICGNDRVDEPMRDFLLDATCMAALGTIADVVPLVGENRAIAVHGLRGLPASKRPGIRALLEASNLGESKLDAYHVGFVLAPRLNACGRMGHADLAIELLTEAEAPRCAEIAAYLNQQNTQRQKTERGISEEAAAMVAAAGMDADERRSIVLAGADWHGGVIGIVASRLVDRFRRPTVLVAFNGDGIGQGSGRSVAGFNLYDALAACGEHLESFGGHAMAAGVRVRRDRVEAFAEAFEQYAREHLAQDMIQPTLRIDAEARLGSIDHNLAAHVQRLAPFGQGNPSPLVAVRGCRLLGPPKRMGRSGNTVSLMLGQNGSRMRAVGFGMGELADRLAGVNEIDVACEPTINRFNGRVNVELILRDVGW
jgi:single-stranded-DNA-specific exonuclease